MRDKLYNDFIFSSMYDEVYPIYRNNLKYAFQFELLQQSWHHWKNFALLEDGSNHDSGYFLDTN